MPFVVCWAPVRRPGFLSLPGMAASYLFSVRLFRAAPFSGGSFMRPSVRTTRRRLATSAMVVLLAVGAAACGGNSEKPPAASSQGADETGGASTGGASGGGTGDGGESGTGTDSGVEYASCMRDNGVQVKDPKPGEPPQIPDGTSKSVLDKLEKVCGKAPGGGTAGGDPRTQALLDDPDFQALRLKYLSCMRKNGYVPPKPNADGSVRLMESPEYTAAQKACKREQDALDKMEKGFMSQGGER
ncbi:hypothetical protein ACFRKB_35930 [Streptomyces scopuliridis]|uniref:hypothetical protein n=1 Tax=Streptomyces scopuliridis TaxID=452529 RepID=UPI00367F27F7